ncbi:response regulator transcription factor [Staphylococcus canis]|uniref:Response regulator protein GraR n=1 Tax=Staphylococcus canis TaxID=2724942 RepID=A0ABS0T5F6_9STAP|nr:response regulator transcription factor [Staphylococcus canis]MBI5973980.1 response regulator transcription factor [Staphylococcus canis]
MDILLVEDDQSLRQEITETLSKWDINVTGVEDFSRVLELFNQLDPDIVLMDITLPKYDGFYWTRLIRQNSNVPIVFLSSRDNPMDQVMSMELGADDYIEKPFNMSILVAKLQAIYRRVYQYTSQETRMMVWRGATVNLTKDCISNEEGTVYLTKTEMQILEVLLKNRNQIVSRNTLMSTLWDNEAFVNDNTLTVNVNRLRKKLQELLIIDAIETKVGRGYIAHD